MLCRSAVFLLVLVAVEVSWALTEKEKSTIVQLHNTYRSRVSPSAADMLKMEWDTTLENIAKAYAKKCIWAHNPDRGRRGENLFLISTPTVNVDIAVEDWYKENRNYNFATSACADKQMCGHYTQVVWATSNRVGCGDNFCEKVEGIEEPNVSLLVCNYEPPGNVRGRKPYTEGPPCSKCPANHRCVNLLCEREDGGGTQVGDPQAGGTPGRKAGPLALFAVILSTYLSSL
ncbi:hypothetical protein NDU88_005310 [Pleurodeles waltl]|uniref:Peptidase inhibitor 16 n=1 Tax=Pleurodeles waltl TaxID=8319 RepID=A0AAV7QEK7_PLEWA|nr:hypothetical protein NDU88_005310 [Pleurodeles waltl]